MSGLSKPILQAFLSTAAASLIVAGLSRLGMGAEVSLATGLVFAGAMNIAGLMALNGASALPTSPVPIGDI
ncbi:MAG: hypothetical protein JSR60_05015 [Proteobacteria bacterium]|nr:hypothetical protein [Pseudomonadota bacterium]